MNKIAFITGATSGIGKASAHIFAKNKYNIIITGRRKDRLEEIAHHLSDKYNVKVLSLNFDVRNREDVETAVNSLSDSWKRIDVLLNNAGLAVGLTNLQDGVYDDWDRMIDTNIKGLLNVTRNIAPLMIANGKGHIINIGSIAGKETYPFGNVYCGTKHAVDSLTKAMRIDMLSEGIKVSQVAPGAVETEFSNVRFKGDDAKADSIYAGFEPLRPEDIADAVYYCASLPAHVNINDMLIMPTAQANATTIIRK